MKKLLSILLVLCLVLLSSCGEKENESTTSPTDNSNTVMQKKLVMVATGEAGSFWSNVEKGARDAAKKYGCTIVFEGTQRNGIFNTEAQKNVVADAIDEGASGIIISSVGDGFEELMTIAFDKKIPVVEFESGLSSKDKNTLIQAKKNPVVSTVGADEKAAGSLCAEKMFEQIKEKAEKSDNKLKVGVVYDSSIRSAEKRVDGFAEKLNELADSNEKTKDRFELIRRSCEKDDVDDRLEEFAENGVNYVFLAGESVVNVAADEVHQNPSDYKDTSFWGFDSGAKQLKWIETEGEQAKLNGSVARDAYNMGYNAVEQCFNAATGKETKQNVLIESHWYDKDNADKLLQDKIVYK